MTGLVLGLFLLRPPGRQGVSHEVPPPTPIQKALQAVAFCDTTDDRSPLPTIHAINALVALGPKKALEVLHYYFQTYKGKDIVHGGLYPLVRCIFQIPGRLGYLPKPMLGAMEPMNPPDQRLAPRYPYALVGDIPLTIASGGPFAGVPEPASYHLDRLAQIASIRKTPLVPVDKPWRLVGQRMAVDYEIPFSGIRAGQNADILALVSTAYRPAGYEPYSDSPLTDTPAGWSQVVAELEKANIHWDRDRELYVRADGSVLPPIPTSPKANYPSLAWTDPILDPIKGRILMQGISARATSLILICSNGEKADYRGITVKVVAADTLRELFSFTEAGTGGIQSHDYAGVLTPGSQVVIELTFGGKTVRSPMLTVP